ncbi:MFS transporter [Nonomuraea sp. NPDC050790]|uniref:MFS transporter n=1 Tax=Nonomuraea sp. NPDC050790 TaxID=3364371 RepID=UPI0037A846AB
MSPRDPSLRLIRAAVFGTACVVVSAGGHLLAGGGAIAPWALALGAAASLALALALGGRERTREGVLAATAGTQMLLHLLFAQASAHVVMPDHGHPRAGMVVAHFTVALLTGWWLHRGESAVWTLLRLWACAPPRPPRLLAAVPAPMPSPVRPAVPEGEPEPRGRRELAAVVHRRGPPRPSRAG